MFEFCYEMKKRFLSAVILSIVVCCVFCYENEVQDGICGETSFYSPMPYICEFLCTDKGIEFECRRSSEPGCQCSYDTYLNKATNTCMPINCRNLDCVGKPNQAFYTCESGSRESCGCAKFVTLDCRTGCMCKNGFCRKGDECVTRACKGSPFD